MKNTLRDLSRRQYLGLLTAGTAIALQHDPLYALMKALVRGIIHQAHAENDGVYPRSHFVIITQGGHSGWAMTYGLQDVASNPVTTRRWVCNSLSGGSPAYTHYLWNSTQNNNGRPTYLPAIYACNIPTSSGGSVPMTDVLNNAWICRGIVKNNGGDPGHDFARVLSLQPDTTRPSLTGIVADKFASVSRYLMANNENPAFQIPALAHVSANIEYGLGYSSSQGTGLYVMRDGMNPNTEWLGRVLDAFRIHNGRVDLNSKAAMEPYIQAALEELGAYHAAGHPGASRIYSDYRNAEALFRRAFGDLAAQWSTLHNKYRAIARGCAQPVSNLITAQWANPNAPDKNWEYAQGLDHLAIEFAIMEFIRANDLVGVATFHRPGNVSAGVSNYNLDDHPVDSPNIVQGIVTQNYLQRMALAMVREFRAAIGPERWAKTVLQFETDFGRYPGDADDGTEHAAFACSTQVFSGAIPRFQYSGNIVRNSPYNWRCFGEAAPTRFYDDLGQIRNEVLTSGHIVSTLARLIGVESPVSATAYPPLMQETSGQFELRLAEPLKTV